MTNNEILGRIFGRMKDEGVSQVLLNRLQLLLDAFGGNIPQFAAATKGQLQATYNKMTPNAEKGLSSGTFTAHERFARLYKESQAEAREVARETVKAQEAREAEKAAMRQELLDRVVDFDALTSAMAALGTLKLTSCSLGRLLDTYELAASAKGGGAKC